MVEIKTENNLDLDSPNKNLGDISFRPVAVVDENALAREEELIKKSERMEKLRSYYSQLGQVRDNIEKELGKILSGSVVEGEIENKFYEFTHSRKAILDEIQREKKTIKIIYS